jgi:thiol-disulfide isomerase/thioredoxin
MNKIICLIAFAACCLTSSAQTTFTALKINPEFPKQNSRVNFEYNQNFSPLIRLPKLDIIVYQFSDNGVKVTEPVITKKGTVHTGSFLVDSNAACIAFGFSSGEEKDLNNNKGYVFPVYNKNNIPVENYYQAASSLYSGYGEYLFGLPGDAGKALAYLEEGFKQHPTLKSNANYLDSYLNAISSSKKKEEVAALVQEELREFENRGNLTDAGYSTLIRWYTKDKKKEKADSLAVLMKSLFPGGTWKREEMVNNFFNEDDLPKRIAIYNDFANRYTAEIDKPMIETMKSRLAMAYGKKKDFKSYEDWSKGLGKETLHSINNDLAWSMAEAGEDLAQAKIYSYAATMYAKNEMLKPTQKKPAEQTTKQWTAGRKATYGMYADTYGFILYKLGDYKGGLPYAREAAAIYEKDAEYNERYALVAEKALPLKEAKTIIEKMVKAGLASSKTKEVLKNLYIKEKQTEKGFDIYLAALEADAKSKKRAEIAKTIINEPAPAFGLKDMDGQFVKLDDLKGKILVVDFWATWCGPCIASMPGMNKALSKYRNDDNVKFLFVDTWESGEDKVKNAKDFMSKKNYPFHVLMDNDNEMVKDFNVRGIPTKFIIDKTGRIRFKAIGFGGNDDALVDELTTMIELAGK